MSPAQSFGRGDRDHGSPDDLHPVQRGLRGRRNISLAVRCLPICTFFATELHTYVAAAQLPADVAFEGMAAKSAWRSTWRCGTATLCDVRTPMNVIHVSRFLWTWPSRARRQSRPGGRPSRWGCTRTAGCVQRRRGCWAQHLRTPASVSPRKGCMPQSVARLRQWSCGKVAEQPWQAICFCAGHRAVLLHSHPVS